MDLNELRNTSLEDLFAQAKDMEIECSSDQDASGVILAIMRAHNKTGKPIQGSGTLEILGDGFGFLRGSESDFSPSAEDVYVSPSQIRRFHLNTGDHVSGQVRPPKESERYFALLRVAAINGLSANKANATPGTSERSTVHASERLNLEHKSLSSRLLSLLCPIAKGQRVLLFAPTNYNSPELLLDIAAGAQRNQAKLSIYSLLVAERPEIVTDFRDAKAGELVASTFDEQPARHMQIADMVIENAKRLADSGQDVLLLVNSLTRLATAASQGSPTSGTNLPLGLNSKGIHCVKRLLAAGRNLKGAGSVTIVGVLRMGEDPIDQFLRQELNETANCEIHLSSAAMKAGCMLPIDSGRYHNADQGRFMKESEATGLAALTKRLSEATTPNEQLLSLEKDLAATKNNQEFLAKLE